MYCETKYDYCECAQDCEMKQSGGFVIYTMRILFVLSILIIMLCDSTLIIPQHPQLTRRVHSPCAGSHGEGGAGGGWRWHQDSDSGPQQGQASAWAVHKCLLQSQLCGARVCQVGHSCWYPGRSHCCWSHCR